MEKSSQTDTTSLPRTTEAATQTGPPLRIYRAKLKAEIARTERLKQQHKEAMGQLTEQLASQEAELMDELPRTEHMEQQHNEAIGERRAQAASQEAELKQVITENSAVLKAKEKDVLDLQITLTEAKERILLEEGIANGSRNYSPKSRRFGGNTENGKKWQTNSC